MRAGPAAIAAIVLAAVGCGRPPEQPVAPAPAGPPATRPSGYRTNPGLPSGTIVVQVSARAPSAPEPATISPQYRTRNPADAEFCEGCNSRGDLRDESFVVDPATLGIANVAVSIRSVAEGPLPPLAQATIDNACCRFVPHVVFAPVGSPLKVRNSDPMSHAIMISTVAGTQLFMATIPSGETAETTSVDSTGILEATCPIHPWMRAWIVGIRHPYVAVTGARGEARIERVPEGAHELLFWHERLGGAVRQITALAGQDVRVALTEADFRRR